jgi:hypothetical protein
VLTFRNLVRVLVGVCFFALPLLQGLYSPIRAGSCLECERGTYAGGALNATSKAPRVDGKGSDQCTTCPGG